MPSIFFAHSHWTLKLDEHCRGEKQRLYVTQTDLHYQPLITEGIRNLVSYGKMRMTFTVLDSFSFSAV